MKVHKCDNGVIKYRLPNIIEGMRLLGKIGVNSDGSFSKSEIDMMADIIEAVEPYIESIECSNAKSWDDLVSNPEYISDLTDIGTVIISNINQTGKDKKNRKKS